MAPRHPRRTTVHSALLPGEITAMCRSRNLAGIVVSRATWLERSPSMGPVVSAPVVAGRTVWDAAGLPDWLHVIEQPNYFGRFETDLPDYPHLVTLQRLAGGAAVGHTITVPAGATAARTATARNLAGMLNQFPGVKLPHGQPQSPWFIVSLPTTPERFSSLLAAAGFPGCQPLGGRFAEFPGGIRIAVTWPMTDNHRFIATVQAMQQY